VAAWFIKPSRGPGMALFGSQATTVPAVNNLRLEAMVITLWQSSLGGNPHKYPFSDGQKCLVAAPRPRPRA
jgi:hypothetical protein